MRVALCSIAYREERLIGKFLRHIPNWVETKMVLVSSKPWFGDELPEDKTIPLAVTNGAGVIVNHWMDEHSQRNSGQDLLSDYDWVLHLDPDEFLDNKNWRKLEKYLEETNAEALVVEGQRTYWKKGWLADPPRDYQMLIASRPHVRFVDKRVVNAVYEVAPVWLDHFSWAKTDKEVWDKITHYGHANDFDTKAWFEKWKSWKPGMKDMHPTTPETLHDFIRAKLPPELKELGLWPK